MGSLWSRFFLSLCLTIFLISLIEGIGMNSGFFETYPSAAFWSPSFVLLLGPGLYLFTKSVLNADFKFMKIYWFHIIPFIASLLYIQLNYQKLSFSSKIEVLDQAINNPPSIIGVITIIIFGLLSVYLFFSFREIKLFNTKLNMEFADLENKNVVWLSNILISFFLIFVFSFIQNILRYYTPHLWNATILFSLVIYIYLGSRLLFKFMEYQVPVLPAESADKKKGKTVEEIKKLKEVADLIHNEIETEKHFLDPDLSLHVLAEKLNLKPVLISQSLNQVVKRNFFDYINKHRIEYACFLLKTYSSKEKNVTEVMYESGFNSKSSFNTAFKKYLGITPTSYKKGL